MQSKDPLIDYRSDFCVIRIPLLSINALKELFAGKEGNSAKLRELYKSPLLQEAIYIASIDFYNLLEKYLRNEALDKEQIAKIENSLLKYFLRSSSRCTPFGIFATVSHCIFGDSTELQLKDNDPIKRSVKIDSQVLSIIIDNIVSARDAREYLTFVSNTSLYKVGKKFRYFEYNQINQLKTYNLTSISTNGLINRLIKYGKQPRTFIEFLNFLSENGFEKQESKDFINSLIDEKILIAKIENHISGQPQLAQLIRQLKSNIKSNGEILKILKYFEKHILAFNNFPSENNIQVYNQIFTQLKSLGGVDKQKSLIQTEGYRDFQVRTIDKKVISDVKDAVRVLCCLTTPTVNQRFVSFKEKFKERYGGQTVPLAIALDPDSGLGNFFTSDYQETVTYDQNVYQTKKSVTAWKNRQFINCLSQSLQSISIDFKDLPTKTPEYNCLPDSFYTVINLFVDKNKKEQIVFQSGSGSSSTNLFSRFCFDSEELYNLTKNEIKKEEQLQPNKIFAEIIHLPQPKMGNVISRPHLRAYEILYLGESSIDKKNRITIDDLFLRVVNDEIVLWSKQLNKLVIPKLTTALNYRTVNLPIFQFLCQFSQQKPTYVLKWDWEILSNEEFLPRVSYKNVILSPRTWNISLSKAKAGSTELHLQNFIKKHKIPDFVSLSSGENSIVLNITDLQCRQIIHKTLETEGRVVLKETLLEDYDPIVLSGTNAYMNEIVIPFHKLSSENYKTIKPTRRPNYNNYIRKTQRNFPFGSEWIFTKIYTGEKTATELLVNEISRMANRFLKLDLIDKWFFVRYWDHLGFHIRFRVHLKRITDFLTVINQTQLFLNKQLSENTIWNFTFDSYTRELERYSPCMEGSENLFYIQSVFTIRVLKYSKDISLRTYITIFALIEMVKRSKIDNTKFLNDLLEAFRREFDLNNDYLQRKLLEKDHRLRRPIFEDILKNGIYSCEYLLKNEGPLILLREYSECFNKIIEENVNKQSIIIKLLPNIFHMFINRMFDSNPRKHELLIYYNTVKFFDMKMNYRHK